MTITVEPDPLTAGKTATVCVEGSSHENETITVDIDNGQGDTDEIEIELDGNGKGCATWTVPPWNLARFNYSTCDEVQRTIQGTAPPE